MELNEHIARFEILEVAAESVQIRLTTSGGEEYSLHLAKGDAVEVHIPEEIDPEKYALLERYLSQPIPQGLMQDAHNQDSSTTSEPIACANEVLKELQDLEPQLRNTHCPQCGQADQLAITHEGIVIICRKCDQFRRVDVNILQRLADALNVTCFSCARGKLISQATEYANILICQNPSCGSNNSWRGVSDRINSGKK